jgi:hypothetical protein
MRQFIHGSETRKGKHGVHDMNTLDFTVAMITAISGMLAFIAGLTFASGLLTIVGAIGALVGLAVIISK